jgi:hypothetical protein
MFVEGGEWLAKLINVRLYRPGDETGIVKLFKNIFDREMSVEEWRWKYTGRGKGKVYSSVAVTETNEIVAHYGGIPHRMIYRGREVYGLAIGDVMVYPEFRGLKLFKKIAVIVPAEAVKDGIILGYGFPNARAMTLPEKLGLYEKVEDVSEATKEVLFNNNLNRFIYQISPLSFEDNGIDALWKSVADEVKLAVIRDRDYLRWRYQKHPFLQYELWGLKKRLGKKLQGLAVLRREGERLLLIDFVCPMALLHILFQKVENYTSSAAMKTLVLWLPEYLKEKLTVMGFAIRPAGTCIPRTTHEKTLTKDDIEGKFFYTMGDTDFM